MGFWLTFGGFDLLLVGNQFPLKHINIWIGNYVKAQRETVTVPTPDQFFSLFTFICQVFLLSVCHVSLLVGKLGETKSISRWHVRGCSPQGNHNIDVGTISTEPQILPNFVDVANPLNSYHLHLLFVCNTFLKHHTRLHKNIATSFIALSFHFILSFHFRF